MGAAAGAARVGAVGGMWGAAGGDMDTGDEGGVAFGRMGTVNAGLETEATRRLRAQGRMGY